MRWPSCRQRLFGRCALSTPGRKPGSPDIALRARRDQQAARETPDCLLVAGLWVDGRDRPAVPLIYQLLQHGAPAFKLPTALAADPPPTRIVTPIATPKRRITAQRSCIRPGLNASSGGCASACASAITSERAARSRLVRTGLTRLPRNSQVDRRAWLVAAPLDDLDRYESRWFTTPS